MSERAYAEVPYPPDAHTASHPDRLATVARLHGIPAPDVEACRVLELGCGVGGNLVAMAASLPNARFVGVDAVGSQIASGNEAIRAAGITNVELREGRIEDLGASIGTFDYVIAHGLFSWVPTEVQDELLALCARVLAPHGVAYVSYNTHPGWHLKNILREAMLLKLHGVEGPRDRLAVARAELDWLAESLPDGGPYGAPFVEVLAQARAEPDAVLFHDWLGPVNLPVHFFRFAMRVERHGLAYLCEAEPAMAADHAPTAEGENARARSPGELVFAEQIYDFLTSRRFRRTLVCRGDAPPKRVMDVHVLDDMFLSTRAIPMTPDVDPRSDVPATFRGPDGEMTTSHPATKVAMALLMRESPCAIPWRDLAVRVSAELPRAPLDELRENLLTAFLSSRSVLELRAFAPPCVAKAGERPTAGPWTRQVAKSSRRVPNLRHEMVDLDEPLRRFLVTLDGTRDRAALVAELQALASEGLLRGEDGQPARPGPRAVEEVLARFARAALLVA